MSKELIEDLRQGRVAIEALSGPDFQELVFNLILERYSLQQRNARISDHPVGEIDIVIEAQGHAVPFGSTRNRPELHFVECKHYRRKLELDTVAKVYCAAIAYQPRTLTIVSSSPLAPQAIDYAARFFDIGTEAGIERARFPSVLFEHVSLERLLGIKQAELVRPHRTFKRSANSYRPGVSLVSWVLLEHGAFGTRTLAYSDGASAVVRLSTSCRYELRFVLHDPHHDLEDFSPKLKIVRRLSREELAFSASPFQPKGVDPTVTFRADPAVLPALAGEPVFLQIVGRHSSRKLLGPVRLPKFRLEREANFLNNLREAKTIEFREALLNDDRYRLILLSGEAGIGKTYFIEEVCGQLAAGYGWQNSRVTAAGDSDAGLFMRLLLPMLSSHYGGSSGLGTFETQVLQEFLSCILRDTGEKDPEQAVGQLLRPDTSASELETITYLCSRLFAETPAPRLLLISNCQSLSPRLMKALQSFVVALNDLGWGGVRIVLEYRDEQSEASESWNAVLREIKSTLASRLLDLRLPYITEEELEAELNGLFGDGSAGQITSILLRKAGGNPLFINQILLHARDQGFIQELPSAFQWRFLINDRVGFSRELEGVPGALSTLLEGRVRHLIAAAQSKGSDAELPLVTYLAIASVVGYEVNEKHVAQGSDLPGDILQQVRLDLFEAGVLRPSLESPPAVFVHELMWLAVRDVVTRLASSRSILRRFEAGLKPSSSSDSIIAGRINVFLADLVRAEHWFNMGYELAHGKGDYVSQRECLLGLREIFGREASPSAKTLRRFLRVEQDLGWNEIMTGSQTNALKVLREVIATTSGARARRLLAVAEIDSLQAEAYAKILTLLARKRSPIEFMENCKTAVTRVRDISELVWTVTRFVIICGAANLPHLSWRAANLCYRIATNLDDSDLRSAILHDIGDLYLVAEPVTGEQFFKSALEAAKEPRQRAACTVTLQVAPLHGRGLIISREEREKLANEIDALGVENLKVRWLMYRGIAARAEGSFFEALQLFRKAADRALLANLNLHLWECYNNIALLHLEQGDPMRAAEYIERAVAQVYPLMDFVFTGEECAEDVFQRLIAASESLLGPIPKRGVLPELTLPRPPRISGSICALIHNIASVTRVAPSLGLQRLVKMRHQRRYRTGALLLRASPLIVKWKRQRLLFSID